MTKRERTRFRKFTYSPYLNPSPILVQLVDFIDVHIDQKNLEGLTKESMFAHLYADAAFDYFTISNHLSDIQKLLEQYFIWEEVKEDKLIQGSKLLRKLRSQGMDKMFVSRAKAQAKVLDKQEYHDKEWFFHRYILEEERYNFGVSKGEHARRTDLSHKLHYQELYILSSMLISLCEWANRRNVVFAGEEDDTGIQDKLDYIESRKNLIKEHVFLNLYYCILKTLIEPDDESYYHLFKKQLLEHPQAFPPRSLTNPFHLAVNYCIKKLNQGETNYVREAFEIYREAIKREALFHEGGLMEGDLKNIVTLGVRLKEFAWTEQFVQNNYQFLPPNKRESALAFNQAYLHYSKGDYSGALALLRTVDFEDVYYQIGAKSMLLKIYFERMDIEPLEALLAAFKQYLYRNKQVSSYQKKINTNFIRFTRKAIKLWGLGKSVKARKTEELLLALETEKEVANIDWLKEVLRK